MSSISYAHSLPDRPTEEWHVLEEHLGDTARRAECFASAFGAGEWARLAGLWHDLGKYSDAFQAYLRACADSDSVGHKSDLAGRVIHSTAGAKHAVSRGLTGNLLAFAIAGHHAGLPDAEAGDSGLAARLEGLKKSEGSIDRAPRNLLDLSLPPMPKFRPSGVNLRPFFAMAFFTRMLFSCLVDADFLDTERFFNPRQADLRPKDDVACEVLLRELKKSLDQIQEKAADTPVNRRRRDVLAACIEKSALTPGFFSLNVPTGGGKTLSSLAFALSHAVKHDLRRVVYAIPFTSIIEQTVTVFRKALGEYRDQVLEHHSNLDLDKPENQSDRTRLAAENFDAPLVVTTNVQLFESLFASRTSRCRKLHRLARSVIILDEAQALPPKLLAPTLAALEELVANYGATVVLCTATQPAIEYRENFPIGLNGVRPIIDEAARLHNDLRRTTVTMLGITPNEDLVKRLGSEHQALCIVNSRKHAWELFKLLGGPATLHLSATMCAAHRAVVIAKIRRRLDPAVNKRCIVISTPIIEAGVDVDFPATYRAAAGLDSVAQASGRCNREGRLTTADGSPELGRVYVFDYDRRDYRSASLVEQAAQSFREVAPDHERDLLSPSAIEAYFRLHYWQQGGEGGRGWDCGEGGQSIMDCFSGTSRKTLLTAQFRTAALAYRLIDDAQSPILVPYGDNGKALISELELMPEFPEPHHLRTFDRKAQRYVVNVYERALMTLLNNGVLLELHGRYYLGNRKAYDQNLGLTFEAVGLDSDRLIC